MSSRQRLKRRKEKQCISYAKGHTNIASKRRNNGKCAVTQTCPYGEYCEQGKRCRNPSQHNLAHRRTGLAVIESGLADIKATPETWQETTKGSSQKRGYNQS
jgi:hypothetical protein